MTVRLRVLVPIMNRVIRLCWDPVMMNRVIDSNFPLNDYVHGCDMRQRLPIMVEHLSMHLDQHLGLNHAGPDINQRFWYASEVAGVSNDFYDRLAPMVMMSMSADVNNPVEEKRWWWWLWRQKKNKKPKKIWLIRTKPVNRSMAKNRMGK